MMPIVGCCNHCTQVAGSVLSCFITRSPTSDLPFHFLFVWLIKLSAAFCEAPQWPKRRSPAPHFLPSPEIAGLENSASAALYFGCICSRVFFAYKGPATRGTWGAELLRTGRDPGCFRPSSGPFQNWEHTMVEITIKMSFPVKNLKRGPEVQHSHVPCLFPEKDILDMVKTR